MNKIPYLQMLTYRRINESFYKESYHSSILINNKFQFIDSQMTADIQDFRANIKNVP